MKILVLPGEDLCNRRPVEGTVQYILDHSPPVGFTPEVTIIKGLDRGRMGYIIEKQRGKRTIAGGEIPEVNPIHALSFRSDGVW